MIARRCTSLLPVALLLGALVARGRAGDPPAAPVGEAGDSIEVATPRRWLESFALDREARDLLDRPGTWDEDRANLAIRTLVRLTLAPPEEAEAWSSGAAAWDGGAIPADDRLVRIEGSAEFVAPLGLPAGIVLPTASRDAAARGTVDLVRVRSAGGAVVDVLTPAAPRAWPRWQAFAEAAVVVGLPLAAGVGPVPTSGDGTAASAWPGDPPALLVAASRVAWIRPDLAGQVGMDAGLLDSVVDGRKLTAEDADAFFALLAAAGRTEPGALAAAAGAPTSIIPLIDPSRHWFDDHRGEPVAISGRALRATRVEIDDPFRRRQTGLDHYWELFVFVSTPPIEVGGKVMDRYPVVCCLRALPEGMPTGTTIAEPVRVAAWAFKSYVWPLPPAEGRTRQREAPLLVGGDVRWVRPAPPSRGGPLEWIVAALAAAVAAGVAAAAWKGRRDARRRERRRREARTGGPPPAG